MHMLFTILQFVGNICYNKVEDDKISNIIIFYNIEEAIV